MKPNLPAPTSNGTRATPTMARAPWLVAVVIGAAVCAGFLWFNSWALAHAPSWSLSQPLVALPSLLLLALVLSIRAWPAQSRGTPPKVEPKTSDETESRPKRPAAANWSEVVRHASHVLRERGYGRADGAPTWHPGTDLVLDHEQRSFVVHARHWRARLVEGNAVRDLAHEIAQRGAVGGLLLCATGSFSGQARQLAKLHGIALLDRGDLSGEPRAPGTDHTDRPAAAPTPARAPEPAAPPKPLAAIIPLLRPDQEVKVARCGFEPTVPMSDAERRRMRVSLRPNHQVKVSRDFEATQLLENNR